MSRLSSVFVVFALSIAGCEVKDAAVDDTGGGGPLLFEVAAEGYGTLDAVPDAAGERIYFVGSDDGTPAIFRVDSDGTVSAVISGSPLVAPENLSLSPDDNTIYVADPGAAGGGAVFAFDTEAALLGTFGGGLAPRGVHATTAGVIFTGSADGVAGVYSAAVGGSETTLFTGAPLSAPGGLVASSDGTIYVADTPDSEGEGLIVKIGGAGATTLASGLWLADPAGISNTLDGSTLVISAHDPATGSDAVLLMDASTGEYSATSQGIEANVDGGGVHRAADANLWAWADSSSGGGRTYRVQTNGG